MVVERATDPAAVPTTPQSLRDLRRRLDTALPAGYAVAQGSSLELSRVVDAEPPRMAAAAIVEGGVMRRHSIDGDPTVGFAAFLDGAQESHVVSYARGIPIVIGAVGAVVRIRRDRRFFTWRFDAEVNAYTPLQALPPETQTMLSTLGTAIFDTSDAVMESGDQAVPHPFAVSDAAVHAVQRDRERLERDLAIAWCEEEALPLFIDGSIAGDSRVARDPAVVGVVKSHRVLYGGPAAFQTILELERG